MRDTSEWLNSTRSQFQYYKLLGDRCFEQLDESDLFWSYNDQSNSISVIVKHLWGNMLSRWTDFLVADGEKEWRDRDGEFEATIKDRAELLSKWEEGWTCLFSALDEINNQNFDQVIYIRNMGHTISEAINRQLAHYAYHIGQIVYVGRMIKGAEWKSLSIPKGGSEAYNDAKFNKEKHKEHYTSEFIKAEKNN